MSPIAALLIILSAVTHAGWNLIGKRDHPTLAYFLAANNFGVILLLPVLVIYRDCLSSIPPFVWLCLLSSGFFLTVCMAGLAAAYRTGDLSVAYPLARALPVLIVAGATGLFGLGQTLGPGFMVGATLVVIGCLLLPVRSLKQFRLRNYSNVSCLMALVAAAGISGYTMVDHEALASLRRLPQTPFSPVSATWVYMCLEAVSASLWKAVFVMVSPRERFYFREVMARFKISALVTGAGIYLTYGLVLLAMNFVTNVSYVAAFRQLSIPLGAAFGMIILKEPAFRVKIFGMLTVFTGLVLVALY